MRNKAHGLGSLNRYEDHRSKLLHFQHEFKNKEQELQNHEDKLFDLRIQGNVSQDDFEKQLQRIRTNRNALTDQLATLQKGLTSAVMETAKTVLELATSAKSLWKV